MKKIILIQLLFLLAITTNSQYTLEELTVPFEGNISDVFCLNSNKAFLTGYSGSFKQTTDTGTTWTDVQYSHEHTLTRASSIDFVDNNIGFVTAKNSDSTFILSTTNSGDAWDIIYTGTNLKFKQLDFIDASTGYGITTTGKLMKITQNGASVENILLVFNETEISSLIKEIDAIDASNMLILFSNNELYLLQNEKTLTKVHPETAYDELNTIEVMGTGEWLISLFTVDDGVSFLTGSILKTSNSGSSWVSKKESCCTTFFRKILMVNSADGVAVGIHNPSMSLEIGLIMVTTDGGESWEQPTLANESIIEGVELQNIKAFTPNKYLIEGENHLYKFSGSKTSINIIEDLNSKNSLIAFQGTLAGEIVIEYAGMGYGDIAMHIYDIKGGEVYRTVLPGSDMNKKEIINIPGLSTGTYFVTLISDSQIKSSKFCFIDIN